jgi:hypothetical protein
MFMILDDLIWLESIVEKLAWKHNIVPIEVEEVLQGSCRISKKETGRVDGEHLYNTLGQTSSGSSVPYTSLSKVC